MFLSLSKFVLPITLFFTAAASAGVEIGGTRIIYNGKNNQAAISVSNPDNSPYLIQSWISKNENGDDSDETFATTPPLFKLTPQAQNSVRVMLAGNTLPNDRESVYWLNIKAIPTSSPDAQNELLIAIKSKMKVLYRPAGLKGDPSLAWQQLAFKSENGKLTIHNPTPYSVSLYELTINGKQITKPPMVLPFQNMTLPHSVAAGSAISWRAINDYGGITPEHKYTIRI